MGKLIEIKVGKSKHAADTIVHVTEGFEDESWYNWSKIGFYHYDESEAHMYGPFETLEIAMDARDKYFAQL